MDGMCFDYDHYFSEETFIIDDFGEIFENGVRIAGANTQNLCKDFDADLRQESPPPGSFIASNRCFEKEVPSLFSEMEYLTEVSPGTDIVLSETIAVNPTEFSCKRSQRSSDDKPKEFSETEPQHCRSDATTTPAVESEVEACPQPIQTYGNVSAPLEYQRILNNYIQKGRRKLEASSYSKMKASCLAKERLKATARSTSTIATVTTPTQPSTGPGGQFKLCPSTSVTAIVNNLPLAKCNAAFDTSASISDGKRTVEMIRSSSSTFPTLHQSVPPNRHTTTVLLKQARSHRCRDCSSSFASSELLRKHSCIIAEQYQCHLCLREFKKRKTLDHHMKSHEKVFSTDDDLRK